MSSNSSGQRIKLRRVTLKMTQGDLAARAGISRTEVTALESNRHMPSVAAALAIADVLGTTVEALFGRDELREKEEIWAWQPQPPQAQQRYWRAEIGGRILRYPAISLPMYTPIPDSRSDISRSATPEETLVLACCDPAAGWLAAHFVQVTGLRLLILPRSSREALEMLRQGLVHMAGLHLSTADFPERNGDAVRQTLGKGYRLLRVARWQEGIALSPTVKVRSVRAARQGRLRWIGRERGSGARACLDQLLEHRRGPRWTARNHRGVVEAVQLGWADAGVCVQLVSAEAGLDFLPVQKEAYDVCFASSLEGDRRVKAFLKVIRSLAYRRWLGSLPGYDASETGQIWSIA